MRQTVAACLLLFFLTVDADAGARQKRKPTRNRTAPAAEVFDPAAVNNPQQFAQSGAAVLRAQILLDRAHFSPGEIDGRSGKNFDRALAAFKEVRGVTSPGGLDEPVWMALNTDTAPVVVPYRITEQDVAGPFQTVPADLMEQSALPSLGYANALEALGEQFHVSPGLLRRMNPGKTFAAGEEILVPNVLTTATGKAARIEVTKAGTITAFDASGKVIAFYPCSSGSEHDPLPIGAWKIKGVAKNPPFFYTPELFWDANPSHSKAKIAPGPNNPVGVVWIDLSKEHYGIHGTPVPANVGHTQSHGCIRLTNWDAMELAGLVAPGTQAILKE